MTTKSAHMKAQSRLKAAKQSSSLEQFQEGSDLDQPNPQSHPQSEHNILPHRSFSFNNHGPGPQFNAPDGIQINNLGNGNQINYPTFKGPVHLSKTFMRPHF